MALNLSKLPGQAITKIASFLNETDRFRMAMTCRHLWYNTPQGIEWASRRRLTHTLLKTLDIPGVDASESNNEALVYFSWNGKTEVVKRLLSDARVSVIGNQAFELACLEGHKAIVEMMLAKGADPSENNSRPFLHALARGHYDIVQMMMNDKRIDYSANEGEALARAARDGKLDFVRHLPEALPSRDKQLDFLSSTACVLGCGADTNRSCRSESSSRKRKLIPAQPNRGHCCLPQSKARRKSSRPCCKTDVRTRLHTTAKHSDWLLTAGTSKSSS